MKLDREVGTAWVLSEAKLRSGKSSLSMKDGPVNDQPAHNHPGPDRGNHLAARDPKGRMFVVNLPELESEALKLPVAERAQLAETLLQSLDALSQDEHRRLWAEEAQRRDAELDADPARGRPAEAVFRDARARLR